MAKALIIVIVLAFTIAPCDYCGGAPGLVACFRGNAKKFDRFRHFITFIFNDRSIEFTLDTSSSDVGIGVKLRALRN
jgi:hypothetical protein